ncbi:MAG: bifunctional DNA-formamidopyrimidine glycosylase/DNA-(apurinic or apyrimidinic site) lyase [Pseudomonadota bacterium]
MPELPEVETVCRGLQKSLIDVTITDVEQRRANLRIPFPEHLPDRLTGTTPLRLYRRAKYLVMDLSSSETLILHLGMSGRIIIQADSTIPAQKHDHLILTTAAKNRIIFNDPRRFGMVDLTPTAELESHRFFRSLGPEPLGNAFHAPALAQKLAGKTVAIKNALLDQRSVAGLGNIYVSEALFHAGIDPRRPAGSLQTSEIEALVPAIRTVLETAIAAGGSSLRDYVQASGALGYFQHQFAVYNKVGQPCPDCHCDLLKTGGIQKITQSGRSTFFCPVKQR